MQLFQIGFLTVRLVDLLDIIIVSFLFYKLFEIVRQSVILKIGVAVGLVFAVWKIVDLFDFILLKLLLEKFLGLGALAIVVLFAPEIRRISADFIQNINIQRILLSESKMPEVEVLILETQRAVNQILQSKEGALLVFCKDDITPLLKSYRPLYADLSADMLVAIFQKQSPLHDGAVGIQRGKIVFVRGILPSSEQTDLPDDLGTRHRAALGISEVSDTLVIVVSEEKNEIAIALRNRLFRGVDTSTMNDMIRKYILT